MEDLTKVSHKLAEAIYKDAKLNSNPRTSRLVPPVRDKQQLRTVQKIKKKKMLLMLILKLKTKRKVRINPKF